MQDIKEQLGKYEKALQETKETQEESYEEIKEQIRSGEMDTKYDHLTDLIHGNLSPSQGNTGNGAVFLGMYEENGEKVVNNRFLAEMDLAMEKEAGNERTKHRDMVYGNEEKGIDSKYEREQLDSEGNSHGSGHGFIRHMLDEFYENSSIDQDEVLPDSSEALINIVPKGDDMNRDASSEVAREKGAKFNGGWYEFPDRSLDVQNPDKNNNSGGEQEMTDEDYNQQDSTLAGVLSRHDEYSRDLVHQAARLERQGVDLIDEVADQREEYRESGMNKMQAVQSYLDHNVDKKLNEIEDLMSSLQNKVDNTDTSNRGNLTTNVEDTVNNITGWNNY